MEMLLARAPDITAAIVWNDLAALGALHTARAAGRSGQDDLHLVTTPTALPDLLEVNPIVLDIHPQKIAERAAALMLAMVAGELDSLPQELIRPTLYASQDTRAL
jgi:DNA-binding LacI/PurR family transcriptional regulator